VLFEAKKRYRVKVLNYMVTSNHNHLLVVDKPAGSISKVTQEDEKHLSRPIAIGSRDFVTQIMKKSGISFSYRSKKYRSDGLNYSFLKEDEASYGNITE
jgi:hypothetical protein